jgi:hypothetical protein
LKASMHSFVVRIALRQHVPLRTCVENFPHARSVAHQISLLPPMMTQPNAIQT